MAKTRGISESRRRNMAAIKGKNTTPEMLVRRFLHASGLRYKLHDPKLPGRPDIVLKRLRTIVEVQGCFWHHHGCANSVWPQTRAAFWRDKILGNRQRDIKNRRQLRRLGWRVITIWECEVRSGKAFPRLRRLLPLSRPEVMAPSPYRRPRQNRLSKNRRGPTESRRAG
jgi:DNA mismatch endonuclease (patch repair protein)